jgi:outer membrane protein, heavy metal efflux system
MGRKEIQNLFFTVLLTLTLPFGSILFAQEVFDLKKTIRTASGSNLALKAQKRNIQVAEADLVTSGLRPNPVLNNQSLQLMEPAYFPANTGWNNGKNRQIWWQLTKPLLLPGVRQNRLMHATWNIRLQEYHYEIEEMQFIHHVANEWIDAWLAYMRTLLFTSAAGVVAGNRNKETTSGSLEMDLLIRKNKLQLRNAESQLENELTDLRILLGAAGKIQIDTTLTVIKKSFMNLDSISGTSRSERPDLLFYMSSVEASNANIRLQKANALPVPELGFIYNPQNTIPYLGFFGTLQIPLFARNQGEIKKSHVLKLQAEETLSFQALKVKEEKSRAMGNYLHSRSYFKELQELLTISDAIHASAENKQNENLQTERLESQLQFYEAAADLMRTSIQLLYATGNLKNLSHEN